MSLKEIVALVSRQEESMLAALWSTMLNVFQTRPGEGMLHDEISNFVSFEQDRFAVFNRRMEFLSDTAGALGLMGTVWGMFTVFFQGTSEQEVILRGMGIALITTLLGLVVSIILNFSSTELSTSFSKRLEQVSKKSDVLRFRLMELAPQPASNGGEPRPGPAQRSHEAATPREPAEAAPRPGSAGVTEPVSQTWRYVELENGNGSGRAGDVLKDFGVVVKNSDGAPAAGVPVHVAIAGADGKLNGGGRTLSRTSDAAGRVGFACALPESAGPFVLDVTLPEQPGPPSKLEVMVAPALPDRLEQEGNHQAAIAGMRLPLPLGVRVVDRFGNAVAGVGVEFSVTEGAGKLGSGGATQKSRTDAHGRAATPFVVSSEAGQNVVRATIDGTKKSVEFIMFGTEV
jgi:hypothetical protein